MLMFLTNNFTLLADSIYSFRKVGWQAAVKSQIRIAVSVYVLVAIVKKHLNLDALFDRLIQSVPSPSSRRCAGSDHKGQQGNDCNQVNRFVF
jgi:hypothetical protein